MSEPQMRVVVVVGPMRAKCGGALNPRFIETCTSCTPTAPPSFLLDISPSHPYPASFLLVLVIFTLVIMVVSEASIAALGRPMGCIVTSMVRMLGITGRFSSTKACAASEVVILSG